MKRKEKIHMTKLALVVMTMLISTAAIADDFQVKIKDDQQLIQVKDDRYKWTIDVDCHKDLDVKEEASLEVSKKRVHIGQTVKVKQGRKTQNCKIKQLAIVSIF